MLTDSEPAYAWVQTTGDRYDPIRYLLLKLREGDQQVDEFAAKQLFDHNAAAIIWVLPEVFPAQMPALIWDGEFLTPKLRGAGARRLRAGDQLPSPQRTRAPFQMQKGARVVLAIAISRLS